ncbi:MAG: putative DNA binding domain-containing protein [Pseudobacteriovorax sp.]|nr:putative DNA binding domain-containing protein [Pseudobacteriovorax sp.]
MNASYDMFLRLKAGGLPLLKQWVGDGIREDLHLDFKRKSKPFLPKLNDDDRRNYSKALSGFANSDGGIIIWGIGAPGSGSGERTYHPIESVVGFAEYLDSFISRLVSPSVAGAENLVILSDEAQQNGYVISYIPKSMASPHRAEAEGLKHYYMRYGESFKVAEHYELEFMFGKRNIPEISIFWGLERAEAEKDDDADNRYYFFLQLGITNQGRAIAQYTCLRVRYDASSIYTLAGDMKSDLIHYSRPHRASKERFYLVTARALQGLVIYPEDYTNFFFFRFSVLKSEVSTMRFPPFEIYFDLFGQDFRGKLNEPFIISGKKIAEKVKKRLG